MQRASKVACEQPRFRQEICAAVAAVVNRSLSNVLLEKQRPAVEISGRGDLAGPGEAKEELAALCNNAAHEMAQRGSSSEATKGSFTG